jgi:hypothetical protein
MCHISFSLLLGKIIIPSSKGNSIKKELKSSFKYYYLWYKGYLHHIFLGAQKIIS